MITGAHTVLHSTDAEADRRVLGELLDGPRVDAGGGRLILALPPGEVAVHPTDGRPRHELHLMCDDVAATVADLTARGVAIEGGIVDRGWGLLTTVRLPSGATLGLYEPRHPVAAVPDPFGGRPPTSHERMTGLPWDASYRDGPAPWDVGPQPAVVRVAAAGGFTGTVLDAGCGSGENALHIAGLGLPVLGVDVAGTALAIARTKAADRGIAAEFAVADALHLERLGRRFDTVLDCGLFHTFDDDERPAYVASLASATGPGGTLYVLCFSDRGPDTGPHPVREEQLRAAFGPGSGWTIAALDPDRVHTRFHPHGASAWLATVTRVVQAG